MTVVVPRDNGMHAILISNSRALQRGGVTHYLYRTCFSFECWRMVFLIAVLF